MAGGQVGAVRRFNGKIHKMRVAEAGFLALFLESDWNNR
jgi:hypothetical protein